MFLFDPPFFLVWVNMFFKGTTDPVVKTPKLHVTFDREGEDGEEDGLFGWMDPYVCVCVCMWERGGLCLC